jgi:hypothetical protein
MEARACETDWPPVLFSTVIYVPQRRSNVAARCRFSSGARLAGAIRDQSAVCKKAEAFDPSHLRPIDTDLVDQRAECL